MFGNRAQRILQRREAAGTIKSQGMQRLNTLRGGQFGGLNPMAPKPPMAAPPMQSAMPPSFGAAPMVPQAPAPMGPLPGGAPDRMAQAVAASGMSADELNQSRMASKMMPAQAASTTPGMPQAGAPNQDPRLRLKLLRAAQVYPGRVRNFVASGGY